MVRLFGISVYVAVALILGYYFVEAVALVFAGVNVFALSAAITMGLIFAIYSQGAEINDGE